MNRIIYLNCDGENKNFYGQGPKDAERVHRVRILGYSVSWVSEGLLFHLYHPRSYNSWRIGEEQGAKNRSELVRVYNMSCQELEECTLSWKQSSGNWKDWENWFVNCGLSRQRTAVFLLKGKVIIQIQLKSDNERNSLM